MIKFVYDVTDHQSNSSFLLGSCPRDLNELPCSYLSKSGKLETLLILSMDEATGLTNVSNKAKTFKTKVERDRRAVFGYVEKSWKGGKRKEVKASKQRGYEFAGNIGQGIRDAHVRWSTCQNKRRIRRGKDEVDDVNG